MLAASQSGWPSLSPLHSQKMVSKTKGVAPGDKMQPPGYDPARPTDSWPCLSANAARALPASWVLQPWWVSHVGLEYLPHSSGHAPFTQSAVAQPLSSCRALQTNPPPVVLAAWGCGMGNWETSGDCGPSWQWRLSYLSGLWDQQGPMRDHLLQTWPVLETPFYPTAQGVGHVALHLYVRDMRAPARGAGRFTNANICRSPSVAKKSLSSAKQLLFFHTSLQYNRF